MKPSKGLPTSPKRNLPLSELFFSLAKDLMPGGVNSPVRAFKSINNQPLFIKKASGSYIWDEDDNRYIDYVGSWGPMIHGHADTDIENAIRERLQLGTSFGAPTVLENQMAEEVINLVPSIEMVRMVNSGTEAVVSAIRLARAFANREFKEAQKNIIVKFEGCYHGHVDALLVQAGSGVATLGLPDSLGVTRKTTEDTLTVPFNDREALESLFKEYGKQIAAIITEPVIGNAGCILPEAGFLEFLREICDRHECLLIFDEVMTGFRLAPGGAQELYAVMPDITTLGKIIGGGLPVGAYGARKEIMSMVAPSGAVYQAGTLSGNPLAMAAGLTSLKKLSKKGFHDELSKKLEYLSEGLKKANAESSIPEIKNSQINQVVAMFSNFFTEKIVKNYQDAKSVNAELFKNYYLNMLDNGVYLAPSSFEAGFLSQAHSYDDLDATIEAHKRSIASLNSR
jgi:glutamate-1-semialdehyde 2,1-aminomutase